MISSLKPWELYGTSKSDLQNPEINFNKMPTGSTITITQNDGVEVFIWNAESKSWNPV